MKTRMWLKAIGSMMIMGAIAGSATKAAAQDMSYKDEDFGCINQQQARQYVDDFGVDVESFGGLELCNHQTDAKKLFNDLQIIEKGQFSNSINNLLIKGFIPANQYYSWMKTQTRGMNRGNDVPFATAYNSWGYFTMQDGWAKLSTLGRVGTVIHEARHTAGYRHYPCNQGPYQGARLDGCDQNYQQAGSHAIEMEYYARVSVGGQNFHPVYKSMARLMALGRTNFVFNSSPIQKREALLALDQNRTPVLFDKDQKRLRETSDFAGRLKRTSFGATLFNGLQAVALDLYELTGFRQSSTDDYSYFKLLLSHSTMGSLKDFEEFDKGPKRHVAAITTDGKWMTFNFPRGSWNSAQSLNMDVVRTSIALPSGEQGYFLVNAKNEIHALNPDSQNIQNTGKTWDANVQSVAVIGSDIYTLKTDGAIYHRTSQSSEQVFDQDHYTEMVSVPLYDAFEVR